MLTILFLKNIYLIVFEFWLVSGSSYMFIFQFKKISLKYVCIYGFFCKTFYDYEIFQYINFIQIILDKYLANF